MDKVLSFIQSCVRRGVSTDDIGYLTKWYFEKSISETKDYIDYFEYVQGYLENKFFNNNGKIQSVFNYYKEN